MYKIAEVLLGYSPSCAAYGNGKKPSPLGTTVRRALPSPNLVLNVGVPRGIESTIRLFEAPNNDAKLEGGNRQLSSLQLDERDSRMPA
jgi:hypothetical protein